jgi:23S rRNA (cytidine1920-2'-O)/16S rRNA (cytidine1409-2'-O)-methyltransferase
VELRRKPGTENIDISPAFDFVTGDLSFISLTLVLPAVVQLLKPHGQLLMLVKPQFELQPGQIGKGGIVRDTALYAEVEKRIRDCLGDLGLSVKQWLDSPIEGGDGNHEFFVWAQQGAEVKAPAPSLQTKRLRPGRPSRRPPSALRVPTSRPSAPSRSCMKTPRWPASASPARPAASRKSATNVER